MILHTPLILPLRHTLIIPIRRCRSTSSLKDTHNPIPTTHLPLVAPTRHFTRSHHIRHGHCLLPHLVITIALPPILRAEKLERPTFFTRRAAERRALLVRHVIGRRARFRHGARFDVVGAAAEIRPPLGRWVGDVGLVRERGGRAAAIG